MAVLHGTPAPSLGIFEVLQYICGGIQIEIGHLSGIGPLLVYQGLDFFIWGSRSFAVSL